MHIPPGFPHQPPQPAPTPEHELKAMLKQLLQGQADGVVDTSLRISTQECTLWRIMLLLLLLLQSKDNYLVKPFRTPRNSASSIESNSSSIESDIIVLKPILLDPYQPVDPSSGRLLSQSHKEVIHKFRRDLSEIGVELPSMESMSEAFEQMKLIQDVMANKEKVSELLEMSTHQINLLTSPTFLPKVKDQGKFTLPCTLGHIELDNALVDSGASINLSPSQWQKSLALLEHCSALLLQSCLEMQLQISSWIEKPRLERPRLERPRSDRPRADRLVQAPCVLDEESLQALFDEPLGSAQKEGEDAASKALVGEKRKNPPAQVSSAKPSQLTMTLFPTKFENGKIEYKIRYKGRSRPFSRAKALVTSEQSRDPTKLKELLSQVLTITLDGGTSSTNA
ncbi:unnamed protein product [Microthlaspi erraticum]|uniref:Aspartic peptidase DDI1-type domain-containing protein n=1 Tax=Microthlaspi erraticum TaxID=1685480 RepID=A0A6D2L302_9BRAS|nr:unnamed protein product [Microthlaspi erraticum]